MTVKQVAHAATIDAPAATVAVNDLEDRGLVVREIDPTNRRCKLVSLTDAGREVVPRSTPSTIRRLMPWPRSTPPNSGAAGDHRQAVRLVINERRRQYRPIRGCSHYPGCCREMAGRRQNRETAHDFMTPCGSPIAVEVEHAAEYKQVTMQALGAEARMCAPPDFADLLARVGVPMVPDGQSVRDAGARPTSRSRRHPRTRHGSRQSWSQRSSRR